MSESTDRGFLADVIEQTIDGHTDRCSCCPTMRGEARPLARAIATALVQLGYDLPKDLDQIRAAAWDEGHRAGDADAMRGVLSQHPNPYRTEETQ